jgi:hypothetical protein
LNRFRSAEKVEAVRIVEAAAAGTLSEAELAAWFRRQLEE